MWFTHGFNTYDMSLMEFETTLEDYAEFLKIERISRPATQEEKECHTPWTAPFRCTGHGRGMQHLTGMGGMIHLDLDAEGWTQESITERLKGLVHILHSTTFAGWRIMLLTDRSYSVAEHYPIWCYANALFDEQLDPATKNANRISYVPAFWEGSEAIFEVQAGEALNVDKILASYVPKPVQSTLPNPALETTAPPPSGIQIITPRMIEQFKSSPVGGRFWHLMISAASRYKREGWTLSAADLSRAALTVSRQYAPGVKRDALREASRALGWVDRHVAIMTAMERLTNRLRGTL